MQSRVVIGAPNRRVGLATVKMYITAVVDLYNKQALADPHSHRPRPRGKLVEVRLIECEQQKHRRENYVDRGVGTVADGYSTTAEMEKLVQYYFEKNTQEDLCNGLTFAALWFTLWRKSLALKKAISYNHHLRSIKDAFKAVDLHKLNIKAFRNVKTLSALWRVWFEGLSGHHPICKLDEVYGVKSWRGTSSDSKFYQRRHNIIIRIERFIQSTNYTKDQALQISDQKKTRSNDISLSLHYISEHLDEFFA
ncbi:hypothetical protein A0J61_05095 [Choanephora cucurbitarum]|uniref:Transcription activator GCR1-like domain-containing protein n=1 Tax=Choanephora cucurbitarum TaxID=101091 RepID=A0A1C7NCK3_9FUNG|nr:hypothetical protein A0J61_05095 [Choanephora cucurbitarum]